MSQLANAECKCKWAHAVGHAELFRQDLPCMGLTQLELQSVDALPCLDERHVLLTCLRGLRLALSFGDDGCKAWSIAKCGQHKVMAKILKILYSPPSKFQPVGCS